MSRATSDRLSTSAIRTSLTTLFEPQAPRSAVGLLHAAIRLRHRRHLEPLTILSCDNLACNGNLLRALVLQFDQAIKAGEASRIVEQMRFPNTMVDRIVPRTGPGQRILRPGCWASTTPGRWSPSRFASG